MLSDCDGANEGTSASARSPNYVGLNVSSSISKYSVEIRIVILFIYPLIFLLGLAGNTMVITVVLKNSKMRNATNYLVMALAFADLMFIVLCVPYTTTAYTLDSYAFGHSEFMCKVPNYMIFVTCLCSVYTLVLMSIDRYIAVVHPEKSAELRTGRNVAVCVTFLWVLFLSLLFPVALGYNLKTVVFDEETITVCFNEVFDTQTGWLFFLLFLLFGFAIPLSVVVVLYGLVVKKLFISAKTGQAIRKSKHRVTRMIVIVIVCFAFCWIPQHVMFMIQFNVADYQEHVPAAFDVFANLCAYMNSCINPILYAFLSNSYRQAFHNLLTSIFRISTKRIEPISKSPMGLVNITNTRANAILHAPDCADAVSVQGETHNAHVGDFERTSSVQCASSLHEELTPNSLNNDEDNDEPAACSCSSNALPMGSRQIEV